MLINTYLEKLFLKVSHQTHIQFVRYLFVGGSAWLIDFSLLALLTEKLSIHYFYSAAISYTVGSLYNYYLSIKWIFSVRRLNQKFKELTVFILIGTIGLGLNQISIWFLTEIVLLHYLISKIVATVLVLLWNFFARKYILFS